MSLDHLELLRAFEALTLPADRLPHAEHLRLAWIYLRERPLPEAMIALRDGLKRFAAHHGKADRYHETITFAYAVLVNQRRKGCEEDWERFRACNPDLFERGRLEILRRYYSEETLASPLAREIFLLPEAERGSAVARSFEVKNE